LVAPLALATVTLLAIQARPAFRNS